jgi:hypothetical protein
MTSSAEGPRTLADMQHFLCLAATTPGGLAAGLRRARERYGDALPIRAPTGVDPRERLSIYARGYLDRLLACLRADYPAVHALLGDSLFERFATDYLRAHPPRSYSLFMLGAGFAAHLEATRPAYDAVPEERRALLDLPIDLARVERARLEALRAPGLEQEGTRPENTYDLLLDAERVVARAPCLRIVESRHDVRAFLAAVDRGEPPRAPPAERTLLAVSRVDYHPTLTPLREWQRAAIELCEIPRPLRDVATTLATQSGESEGAVLADLSLWLPLARQQGLVTLTASYSHETETMRRTHAP